MKLSKEDVVRIEDDSPLELFRQGIKSKETLDKYTRTLRQVTCGVLEDILKGSFEERVAQLVKLGREDPMLVRDLLLNVSKMLRKRTELPKDDKNYLNPDSIGNYFKPVKKLFDMNDVSVPWKRIYATYPERDNVPESRGWARDEIAKMLKYAHSPMERALVLVLASSGMRAGGLDLHWEDLTPVYRVKDGSLVLDPGSAESRVACAVLHVYRGSAESYLAFITPEAFDALQEYGRTWAEWRGHLPQPKDPIFLVQFGAHKNASTKILRDRVIRMVTRAGLRGAKQSKRYEVPVMNGFRRYWNKTCKESLSSDSPLASLIKKEYMMGHRGLVALDQNYFKTNLMELAIEYVGIVPDLTIDDAERLRRSNQRMSANIQELESEKDASIADLQKKVADLEEHNREVTGALERAKSEKGVSSESAESMIEMMHRMKKDHDAAIEKIRAEHKEGMDRVGKVVDNLMRVVRMDSETIAELEAEAEKASGGE